MPVRRRTALRQTPDSVPPAVVGFLLTGDSARDDFDGYIDVLAMRLDGAAEWATIRDRELPRWAKAQPGTRPWAWWRFDGPRWRLEDMPARISDPSAYWATHAELCEPRRRLGGTGTPEYEVLATWPALPFGLPSSWVDPWAVSYYNGRARNIRGERIGTEYHEGQFHGVAPDPHDPPMFESEAAYIERHGLWLPGERARIRPAAFDPYRLPLA